MHCGVLYNREKLKGEGKTLHFNQRGKMILYGASTYGNLTVVKNECAEGNVIR